MADIIGGEESVIKCALKFDMRAPAFGTESTALYGAALEMAGYADAHGLTQVSLMEHHSSEDGYLPSPLSLASAIAARTTRMRLQICSTRRCRSAASSSPGWAARAAPKDSSSSSR